MKREAFFYILLGVMSAIIVFSCSFVYNAVYPLKYKDIIIASCQNYGLDHALVASIIYTESHFKADALSKKGAVGLMQLMPSTAASFSTGDIDLFDPQKNIETGCAYLKYLFKKYGDKIMVLASYNAGETQARVWKNEDQKLDINKVTFAETHDYILKVLKMEKVYKDRF